MNVRWVGKVVLIGLALGFAAQLASPKAYAEWYRPLTWGKKDTASHQKKKRTGVVGGTKRAISQTADALTPWDNKKKETNPIAGAGRFFRPDLAHKKKNEATWYRPATWFRESEADKKPLTVPDWMSQERPGFENR